MNLLGVAQRVIAQLRARADLVGACLAALYGLPTLGYPFGRDQAIFCYVGREWTAGRLPYKEAFDIKPPGIYAVYALAGKLFGFQVLSIRLLELMAVLVLGACVSLAVRRDQPRARGELGATMLITSAFYYTLFNYWDTGQVEFWEALFALAGYVAAERTRSALRAALFAGLLGGCAVLFKTPIVLVLPIAGCVVVARAFLEASGPWLRRVRAALAAFAIHCVAGIAVVGLAVGYFALRGGWPALVELAGYTATYVKNTQASPDAARNAVVFFWVELGKAWSTMVLASLALGIAFAIRRRSYRALGGVGLAFLLSLTAAFSVAVQVKFWSYHWVVMVPFVVLSAAYGLAELARVRSQWLLPVALLATLIGYFWPPPEGSPPEVGYRAYVQSFTDYLRGDLRRVEFLRQFGGPYNYSYLQAEQASDAIVALAQPGDRIHVRGFEPAIYILTRMSTPSRWASEAPLLGDQLTYNRDAWLAEHEASIWSNPPRFFVTFTGNNWDLEFISSHGYHQVGGIGQFVWLERNGPSPPLPPAPPPPAQPAGP